MAAIFEYDITIAIVSTENVKSGVGVHGKNSLACSTIHILLI